MGLFDSSRDVNYDFYKLQPGTSSGNARSNLINLSNQSLNFPIQGTAGMTGTEQGAQSLLAQLLSGGMFEDPATSQYYQGMRGALREEEEGGVNAMRRRSQLAGMGASTGAATGEGKYRSTMSNQRMSLLGGLYNQERNRDNPYTRLEAVSKYGGLPRQIEQQGMNAQWQQQLQNLLAPYQYQAPLWQQAIGNEMWVQPTVTSNPSGFSQLSSMAPMIASIMSGIPMGGGGGGAGTPGFNQGVDLANLSNAQDLFYGY
jgi:hypothetical protein